MYQWDFFDGDPSSVVPNAALPPPAAIAAEPTAPLLAAPCGFVDRRNRPCRRMASEPLLLDGIQLVHRGASFLHCDPACWRGLPETGVTDLPGQVTQGDEDPGWNEARFYPEDEWSRWERVDDHGVDAKGS